MGKTPTISECECGACRHLRVICNTLIVSAYTLRNEEQAACLKDDPIIAGLDVARGGGDWNVVRFRKGLDGRSIPPIRIPGEQTRDSTVLVSKVAELLSDTRPERRIAMMFVDSALGGPVVNRLHQLGFRNVSEINFGSAPRRTHTRPTCAPTCGPR